MALEPEQADIIPDYSLASASAALKPDGSGAYTATVTITLKDTPADDLSGSLQVVCGQSSSALAALKKGVHTYTLTLPGVPSAKAELAVVMDAVQDIEDVFYLEAEGGRGASQTMGGYISISDDIHTTVRVAEVSVLPSVPATGDGTPVALLTAMALLTLAGMMMLRRRRA